MDAFLNPLFLDPTIVYFVLIGGLWLLATAVYMPGTGIAEVIALVVVSVALYGMTQLPTNWTALVVVVLGVSVFIVVPFVSPRYARYAEVGLIGQVAGSFFLFEAGTRVNPILIVILAGLAFTYNRFLLVPLMTRMREMPPVNEEKDMLLGAQGRVVAAAHPPDTGTAQVLGELWTIRTDARVERGDIVRVVEVNGLELEVVRVKAKGTPPSDDVVLQ